LTRESILLRKKMDAGVKPAHDELKTGKRLFKRRTFITLLAGAAGWPLGARAAGGDAGDRVPQQRVGGGIPTAGGGVPPKPE
jgi:hypothetical protein